MGSNNPVLNTVHHADLFAHSAGDYGLAVNARLNSCLGVSPDGLGGLYIAGVYLCSITEHCLLELSKRAVCATPSDNSNHCIRFVSSAGVISPVAGTCGTSGYNGDGGLATSPGAYMKNPLTVAFESGGGLFISEQGKHPVVNNYNTWARFVCVFV